MNDDIEEENEKETTPAKQFAGFKLEPLSYGRKLTYYRVAVGQISRLESASLTLYILTRTPAECDEAREPDEIRKFRIASEKWAETAGMQNPEVAARAIEVSEAIWSELTSEESVSVKPDEETGGAKKKRRAE